MLKNSQLFQPNTIDPLLYLIQKIIMSQIQGYQVQGQIYALDTNKNSNMIVAGSRQCIIVLEINVQKQYWFEKKHLITRYRYENQTKPLVNALDWNKNGQEYLAIGTMHGYVFVYDLATDKPTQIFAMKGPDSTVKKITWEPESTNVIYSASHQYCIMKYDLRCKQVVQKHQYDFSVKFKDIKFNPHRKNVFAAGEFSQFVQLFDIRKLNKSFICTSRCVEDQSGCVVDWDPNCATRLATAGAKSINIWSWEGAQMVQETEIIVEPSKQQEEQQQEKPVQKKITKQYWAKGDLQQSQILQYSKINTFRWMRYTQDSFAISDHYIYLYNRKNPDVPYKQFGGNSKHVDCWLMNNSEELIISASMTKNKGGRSKGITAVQNSLIVVQRQENGIRPFEERLNYPVTFNCLNQFATTVKQKYHSNSTNPNKGDNNTITTYEKNLIFSINNFQNDFSTKNFGSSLKKQIEYLDKEYILNGKPQHISQKNSAAARYLKKTLCQQLWRNLFYLAFPQPSKKHTVHSIFEQSPNFPVKIENNCITVNSNDLSLKSTRNFQIENILQQLVDQNQLQTAVAAAICLLKKDINKQSPIISQAFMQRIVHPYIQLLRNLELYVIATNTLLETGMKIFRQINTNSTKFSISCGTCKKSLTKNMCTCNNFCALCRQSLKQRMIIWCKFCGHGGHAQQFVHQFQKRRICPQGCEHNCFTVKQQIQPFVEQDRQIQVMSRLTRDLKSLEQQ